MKKILSFASTIRVKSLLCCGAAILLSACGAGSIDPVTGQALQTAAAMSSSGGQVAANGAAPSAADSAAGSAANIDPRYAAGGATQPAPNIANAGAPTAPAAPTATPATAAAPAGSTPAGADDSSLAVQTVDAAGNIVEPGATTADPGANTGAPAANTADPALNAGAPQ
jgi:hypothetical protein